MFSLVLAVLFFPAHQVLIPSVRVNGTSCGVVIGKDLVLSTGHLSERTLPQVEVFYQNGVRLHKPVMSEGKILLLIDSGMEKGVDFCIISVKLPPGTVSARPSRFLPKKETIVLSVGCDLGIIPTCFQGSFVSKREGRDDFWIQAKSKPGRSGGALFSQNGELLGVCWGGTGEETFFTEIDVILSLMKRCGVGE